MIRKYTFAQLIDMLKAVYRVIVPTSVLFTDNNTSAGPQGSLTQSCGEPEGLDGIIQWHSSNTLLMSIM